MSKDEHLNNKTIRKPKEMTFIIKSLDTAYFLKKGGPMVQNMKEILE